MRLLVRHLTQGPVRSALLTLGGVAVVGSLLSGAGVPLVGPLVTLLLVLGGLVLVARLLLGR